MSTTFHVKEISPAMPHRVYSKLRLLKTSVLAALIWLGCAGCSQMEVAGDWTLMKMEKDGKVLFDFSNNGEAVDNIARHMEASAIDEAELKRILDRTSLQMSIGAYRGNFLRLNVDHSFRSKPEILSPTIPYYATLTNDVSGYWKYSTDDSKLMLNSGPGIDAVYTVKVDGNQMRLTNESNVVITLVETL